MKLEFAPLKSWEWKLIFFSRMLREEFFRERKASSLLHFCYHIFAIKSVNIILFSFNRERRDEQTVCILISSVSSVSHCDCKRNINNNCLLSGKLSLMSAIEMKSWKSGNIENKRKSQRKLFLFVKCSMMKTHEKWNALFYGAKVWNGIKEYKYSRLEGTLRISTRISFYQNYSWALFLSFRLPAQTSRGFTSRIFMTLHMWESLTHQSVFPIGNNNSRWAWRFYLVYLPEFDWDVERRRSIALVKNVQIKYCRWKLIEWII